MIDNILYFICLQLASLVISLSQSFFFLGRRLSGLAPPCSMKYGTHTQKRARHSIVYSRLSAFLFLPRSSFVASRLHALWRERIFLASVSTGAFWELSTRSRPQRALSCHQTPWQGGQPGEMRKLKPRLRFETGGKVSPGASAKLFKTPAREGACSLLLLCGRKLTRTPVSRNEFWGKSLRGEYNAIISIRRLR